MSVSPQPPAMTSPPPNGTVSSQSNAQLAQLLTASYRESDNLRKDLTVTRKRLEKAERLVASYASVASPPTANNGNGTLPISETAQRVIAECEARADRAEHARDEADARRRVISDAWEELHRYLAVVELRAADARAGFARLVAEGGGQLVLAPVPFPGYFSNTVHTPSVSSPAIMLVPPPPANHRSHRHSSSLNSTHTIPPLPPPPHPTSSRVRPRSGSIDDAYQLVPGQPPAKRSRSDRDHDRVRDKSTLQSDLTSFSVPWTPPRRRCPPSIPSSFSPSCPPNHPRRTTSFECPTTVQVLFPLVSALPFHR